MARIIKMPWPHRDSPAIHGRQTRQALASVTNRRSSSRADWLNVPGRPYELDLPCSALSVPVGGSASGYGVRLLTEAVLNELQVDSGSG
jgi:hypothetical protein